MKVVYTHILASKKRRLDHSCQPVVPCMHISKYINDEWYKRNKQSDLLSYNPETDACSMINKAGADACYKLYNPEANTQDYDPEADNCYKLITLGLMLVTSYITLRLTLVTN